MVEKLKYFETDENLFTEEDQEEILNALYTGKNDDTLVRYGTDTVTKAGINRLKPKSLLKDDVMTFYFKLIMKRDEELSKKKTKRKKCTFFKLLPL